MTHVRHLRVWVCVSQCMCMRAARVRICTSVIHTITSPHSVTFMFVCVFDKSMTAFIARPPRFLSAVCTRQSLEQ